MENLKARNGTIWPPTRQQQSLHTSHLFTPVQPRPTCLWKGLTRLKACSLQFA